MTFRIIPLLFLTALVLLQFTLINVPPVPRVIWWYSSQIILPLAGFGTLVASLVYTWRKKRWTSVLGWMTCLMSGLTIVAPYLSEILGQSYPASLENTKPSLAVRIPLDGPVRVAWGGDKIDGNYHITAPDQRWAYDLVVAPYFTGSKKLGDYGCFGKPVLAPQTGKIVFVHDGEPDQIPPVVSGSAKVPEGNHILLSTSQSGNYLMIAHLKSGSILVAKDEMVKEGQVIAACGNSGESSEPHVHIDFGHYLGPATDQNAISYGLPLFFRDHEGPSMPNGGFASDGTPKGDIITHKGPPNTVVR